jgi:hypothetical protein
MLLLKTLSEMNKKLVLAFTFLLLITGFVQAQTKKMHQDPLIWTNLQADYYLPNQSFFFFRNQWRHNTDSDFGGIKESGILNKFYEVYVLAGYDHKFTDHWRASLFGRYTFTPGNDNKIFQAALRHNGKIGKVDFLKRVAYDYIIPEIGDSRGRFRPAVALEKNFKLGNHILRPSLSYELFFYQDFKDDNADLETRKVDRTRLRIAASFEAMPWLWLTPYFMKQTEYYNVITTYTGEFDQDGNPVVKEQGGKRNRIEPIIALDIRFILPCGRINHETIPDFSSLNNIAGN